MARFATRSGKRQQAEMREAVARNRRAAINARATKERKRFAMDATRHTRAKGGG